MFALALLAAPTSAEADADATARQFVAHALAFRSAAVDGAGGEVIARIPGAAPRETASAIWPPFFENAVVALGRMRSPAPIAIYYNPLLDVALLTIWMRQDDGFRVSLAWTLPGERLDDPRAAAPPLPVWTSESHGSVDSLADIARARLEAFYRSHPPIATEGSRHAATFAADAANGRAVLPRLQWNAAQRARWNSGADPWLRPTLSRITRALSLRDAVAVLDSAPLTDAPTAEAVASLPPGFADRLVLDMVLDAGEDRRLLIGSLPEDGDVYFLIGCRIAADACSLLRITMISLFEMSEPEPSDEAQ